MAHLHAGIWVSWLALAVACGAGCRARTAAHAPPGETPEACAERQRHFAELVQRLPDSAAVVALRTELPEASLGAVVGLGSVLEVATAFASLEGQALAGSDAAQRAAELAQLFSAGASISRSEPSGARALYVAAARDVDVATLKVYLAAVPKTFELRLLIRSRTLAPSAAADASSRAMELAARLLDEPDTAKRAALARQGFAEYSSCSALEAAVAGVHETEPRERWPKLKRALAAALPSCACDTLDTRSLGHVVLAEQRAGTMSLGWLPLEFLRDTRCSASMPQRALQKLVTQIEEFDQEFAGAWQSDALRFDDVVTNERLLGFFCDALPGETLAALSRARATLHLRAAANSDCEPWRLEPLSPGAPMGTLRRLPAGPAFHYWQAAEEVRLFGPAAADGSSKPTDRRDWSCDENLRLTAVDHDSIDFEQGEWFLSADACRASAGKASLSGCVAERARPDGAGEGAGR